jgi:DNA polymerase elongation subunit (family B)
MTRQINGTKDVFVHEDVRQGIARCALYQLFNYRNAVKALQKKAKTKTEEANMNALQNAIKLVMNSYYGGLASKCSACYCPWVSSSVTSEGRDTIQTVISMLSPPPQPPTEEANEPPTTEEDKEKDKEKDKRIDWSDLFTSLQIVYGDTDSVFVKVTAEGVHDGTDSQYWVEDLKILFPRAAELVRRINASNIYRQPMELQLEKVGINLALVNAKMYAGLFCTSPTDKIKFMDRGLQTVRRETPNVTRMLFRELLDLMVSGVLDVGEYKKRIERQIKKMMIGPDLGQNDGKERFPLSDFEMSNELGKNISDYDDPDSQVHVQAVLKWPKEHEIDLPGVGDRVPYYFAHVYLETKATKKVVTEFTVRSGKHVIDTTYYLEHKLKVAITNLLVNTKICAAEDLSTIMDAGRYDRLGLVMGKIALLVGKERKPKLVKSAAQTGGADIRMFAVKRERAAGDGNRPLDVKRLLTSAS